MSPQSDWIEAVRRWLYPRLHAYLKKFGGYGVAKVYDNQFVGSSFFSEDKIEIQLYRKANARRNAVSAYKTHYPSGRASEGSWRITHEAYPNLIPEGMQVHITLFQRNDGEPGRDIFAHLEDDWEASPIDHLKETHLDAERGVKIARKIISEDTEITI